MILLLLHIVDVFISTYASSGNVPIKLLSTIILKCWKKILTGGPKPSFNRLQKSWNCSYIL